MTGKNPPMKEFVQSSKMDHCGLPASTQEQYITWNTFRLYQKVKVQLDLSFHITEGNVSRYQQELPSLVPDT